MPKLAAMLMRVFGALFGSMADALGRKAALVVATTTMIGSIVAAAVASVTALCAALIYTFPGPVGLGVWMFVPDNASACVAVCVACDGLLAVASWWRANVRLGAQVAA